MGLSVGFEWVSVGFQGDSRGIKGFQMSLGDVQRVSRRFRWNRPAYQRFCRSLWEGVFEGVSRCLKGFHLIFKGLKDFQRAFVSFIAFKGVLMVWAGRLGDGFRMVSRANHSVSGVLRKVFVGNEESNFRSFSEREFCHEKRSFWFFSCWVHFSLRQRFDLLWTKLLVTWALSHWNVAKTL